MHLPMHDTVPCLPCRCLISCPPGRPLRRYGGTDDGAKLVCDVKPLPRGCVIYSMGSAGACVLLRAHQRTRLL